MENNFSLRKYLTVLAGVIAVAIAGYVVYRTYLGETAATDNGDDTGIINENAVQQPETDAEKTNVLDTLKTPTGSLKDSMVPENDAGKIKLLRSLSKDRTRPSSDSTVSAGDAEKIKLLESLRK